MHFYPLHLCHKVSNVQGQALYPAVDALLENARSPHFIHVWRLDVELSSRYLQRPTKLKRLRGGARSRKERYLKVYTSRDHQCIV